MDKTRVAIFIDYQNMVSSYTKEMGKKLRVFTSNNESKKSTNRSINGKVWENFNSILITELGNKDSNQKIYDHVASYIVLAIKAQTKRNADDRKKFNALEKVASLDGFMVHYELRKELLKDEKQNDDTILYKDWGVDAHIACQMLFGAFVDNYDVAILVSDDQDFIPVVELVQRNYGKKVFCLGNKPYLKSSCYGSINYKEFISACFELEKQVL